MSPPPQRNYEWPGLDAREIVVLYKAPPRVSLSTGCECLAENFSPPKKEKTNFLFHLFGKEDFSSGKLYELHLVRTRDAPAWMMTMEVEWKQQQNTRRSEKKRSRRHTR